MQCTVLTDQGVIDLVPGRPRVTVEVDQIQGGGGTTPQQIGSDALATTNVSRETQIAFSFNDVMNVASLVNPVTNQSSKISVAVDIDGDPLTDDDREAVAGNFLVDVDLERLSTSLVFTPTLGFPSSGDPLGPLVRTVIVEIQAGVIDLKNNAVEVIDLDGSTIPGVGGGELAFYVEQIAFPHLTIPEGGEQFTEPGREDVLRSGASWGAEIPGYTEVGLAASIGGGSGRLGDLIVGDGETVTLNTDMQVFPLPGQSNMLIGNADANGKYPGDPEWDSDGDGMPGPDPFTITDGTFEFESIDIKNGGTLIFEGDQPVRLFARGFAKVGVTGVISISGGSPATHDSTFAQPTAGVRNYDGLGMPIEEEAPFGAGGPAAGDGGYGADRWAFADMLSPFYGISDVDFGTAMVTSTTPAGYGGGGHGGVLNVDGSGAGVGGARNPTEYPTDLDTFLMTPDTLYMNLLFPMTPEQDCHARQVGGSGSGGSYATTGGDGVSLSEVTLPDEPLDASNNNDPENTGPGTQIVISGPVRTLKYNPAFESNFLWGGSGGGGGGNHPYNTSTNGGQLGFPCLEDEAGVAVFDEWHDHSGAPGGGGGGAIQFVAGKSLDIDGIIDASGGNGGSSLEEGVNADGEYAMPGGAGSGGGIRLQANVVSVAQTAGRLIVAGGQGGISRWDEKLEPSVGGAGGTGLVRIEAADEIGPEEIEALAASIEPIDENDVTSAEFLSVIPLKKDDPGWDPRLRGPETFCASSSCWIQPSGSFFQVNFDEDFYFEDTGPPDAPEEGDIPGWNMTILYKTDNAVVEVPFRGYDDTNTISEGGFEEAYGNKLNHGLDLPESSPVAVRFQGARVSETLTDPCALDLGDLTGPIVPGSLTPWVEHPAELNEFNPNIIRFMVTFDTGLGTISEIVLGVTDLRIEASPD